MLSITLKTKEQISIDFDEFGDSYTELFKNVDELVDFFAKMDTKVSRSFIQTFIIAKLPKFLKFCFLSTESSNFDKK